MDDVRRKTPEERLAYFQEKLAELIKKTDMEPLPTLAYGNSGIAAQITIIDLQNPTVLQKYGRRLREPIDDKPSNPIAN